MLNDHGIEVRDDGVKRPRKNPLQQQIQDLMDAKGMTQADLARASGIPVQTLSNLLSPATARERRQPRPSTLKKIAKGLKVRESILLDAMNQTKGYETERANPSRDPDVIALATVAEMLSPESRRTVVIIAKALLNAERG